MAVLGYVFDERDRKFLSTSLLFINLSVAFISLVTVVVGLTLAILFYQQRDVLKDFGYNKLTLLIVVCGLILLGLHLFGAKVSFDCGSSEAGQRFKNFMPTFLWLLLVAKVLLMIVSISASSAIYQFSKGYEKGFSELMEAYDADESKKMEIDLLQVKNKCCGSTGYKSWIEISWHADEFIRPELRGSKSRGVPFTCCNPEYMGPCLHDAGENSRPGYKKVGEKSFYPDGCADAVTLTLRWILAQLSHWLILPMFLEVLIAVGTKYLHTSINSAEEEGDREGPGFGYLMEKCPVSCLGFLEGDFTGVLKRKVEKE